MSYIDLENTSNNAKVGNLCSSRKINMKRIYWQNDYIIYTANFVDMLKVECMHTVVMVSHT